jgi:hypothetical protein
MNEKKRRPEDVIDKRVYFKKSKRNAMLTSQFRELFEVVYHVRGNLEQNAQRKH